MIEKKQKIRVRKIGVCYSYEKHQVILEDLKTLKKRSGQSVDSDNSLKNRKLAMMHTKSEQEDILKINNEQNKAFI